jgi:hypothetical protein
VILVSEEQEIALGEVLHREALRQSIFSQDVEANRLVQKVGRRVAQVINRPDYSWEFVVVDDPEIVNAWVFPGGKVGVYTGLFPVVDDEAGLAVILCHAAAHALARHHGEKTSRDVLMEVGSMGVTFGPNLARHAYGLGTRLGMNPLFDQAQESEADALGLLLAAKAGYDPQTASEVWKRLAEEAQKRLQPPEFLSTHPHYEIHLQNIARWLPEALKHYRPDLTETPEKLPSLVSLQPTDEDEKDLILQMGTLDRMAATSPGGEKIVASATAQVFGLAVHEVEEKTHIFSLRPGELALALALSEVSKESLPSLIDTVDQTHSWPAVARNYGIVVTSLTLRLQTVTETAQTLATNQQDANPPTFFGQ